METTVHRPPPFVRSDNGRIVAGVCSGLANAMGVDAWIVRAGFFLMSLGAGAGLILYAIAYLVSAAPDSGVEVKARAVTERHTAGFLCIAVGVLATVQAFGIGLPPNIVVPAVLLVAGTVIMWARMDETDRARVARDPISILGGRRAWWRFILGGVILATGVAVFLSTRSSFETARAVLIGSVSTLVGLFLLVGPWLFGLIRQATDERRIRIRSEERAEMSAHLHDSVLNTLALIQRSESSPEVIALARKQERELRAWMQGRTANENERLDAAVDAIVTRVEEHHAVSVDAVVVGGELEIDDRVTSFVAALQEAVVNAARHSGAPTVSVYVEVENNELTAFVRDQGRGFEIRDVPQDRRGIADSIEGRMRRAGGSAQIRSKPGDGTEVEIRMPRSEK